MANPKNKIIGFDLDGVILDHADNKMALAKDFGWKLKLEQTQSEIIKKIIPRNILNQLQEMLYNNHEIALRSPVMRGARGVLLQIKNKHPYFLISRRKKPETAIKIMKLKRLWPQLFNASNTFFVREPNEKNEIGKKLGITHYIDDEIKILETLTDIKNKILFAPYNSFAQFNNFTKISSWKELIDLIDS